MEIHQGSYGLIIKKYMYIAITDNAICVIAFLTVKLNNMCLQGTRGAYNVMTFANIVPQSTTLFHLLQNRKIFL